MPGISSSVVPIAEHTFFQQPILKQRFRQRLLQIARLPAQPSDLIGGRLTSRIPRQPFPARFEKLFRPDVVKTLSYPLPTAQFGDALLTPETFQNNPVLLFG
jgi:hypothetical protein